MKKNVINVDSQQNKELIMNSKKLFVDYFKEDRFNLSNNTITVVSIFDHWLSFDEGYKLLPGWSDKNDTDELIAECKLRCEKLTNFFKEISDHYEVFSYKWRGRRKWVDDRPPRNDLQFKRFVSKESLNIYLQYTETDYSVCLYIPDLNALMWNKDDYSIHFMHKNDSNETRDALEQFSRMFALHVIGYTDENDLGE